MKISMLDCLGLLAFVAVACASGGWQSESATAPGADPAAYASFGWLAERDGPGTREAPLSILDAKLRDAIRAGLVAKGYREVEAKPDFRIGFETETRAREQTSSPVRVGIGVGTWGEHVGTSVGTSVPVGSDRVTTVAETRLTIRAVDASGQREVWVGSATGEVREGDDRHAVDEAVAAALDGFPARRR